MGKMKKFFQYDNIGYLFVLPAFAYMLFFVGYPIVSNIILSFQDVTLKTLKADTKAFVGFQNYIELFQQDHVLMTSLWNTLFFTVACLLFQFVILINLRLIA